MSVARLSVRAWGAILAAYLLAVLVAAGSWSLPGLVDLERLAYDLRLALAAEPAPQDPRIVLVTFDEWSVAQTRRRSPLDRKTLAAALARLDRLGPRAIGVDVLFDQPGVPTDDDRLAQTLASLRTPVFVADDSAGAGELLKPWQRDSLHSFLDRFGGAARRGASAALFADSDGVVRRTAPAGRRTLADALAQTLGAPVRRDERAIDYRRPSGADEVFARLPILTLATAPDATLALYAPLVRGRAVLVGAELDNEDRHRTPLSLQTGRTTSGLEIQAASLATLLDGPSPNAAFTPLFWLLALAPPALGVLVGLLRLPAWARVLIVLGTTTAVALAAWAWELQPGVQTYGLPIVGPAAAWLFTGLVAGAASAAATNEERRLAREIARRYLPPDVAQEIERRPELLGVHGRRLPLAIVFTDLAGFTTMSEVLAPETLSEVLNSYLDGMTEAAQRHGATLDKFIGDAVVCFWGAPIPQPDAAARALAAALAMQAFAREHRAAMAARGIAIGETRIGAHYGEAVVGNFGSRRRVQYTAMGDAMNLAARLESANKQLGTELIASGALVDAAGWAQARDLGAIVVKGRREPVRIFQLDVRLSDADIEAHRARLDRLRDGRREDVDADGDPALVAFLARVDKVGPEGVWALDSK